MKYFIAAAVALGVIGGSAATAQPMYDRYSNSQTYYDQRPHYDAPSYYDQQAYRGQPYGGYYAPPTAYGYPPEVHGNAYRGGSTYFGAYDTRRYSYNNRYDRHDRRDYRRHDRNRHYVAPGRRRDRHH